MIKDKFILRHNGPREEETGKMLEKIGISCMDELISKTIPKSILLDKPLNLKEEISEYEFLKEIKHIASKNILFRTFIGMGYYGTITPSVILRNILENPSWYTSYTPYQAEISQGRLEALLNFQTVIIELTKMDIANASLLDEATAAAEAMIMLYNARSRDAVKNNANVFLIDENIFTQTIEVIKTRAMPLNIEIHIGLGDTLSYDSKIFRSNSAIPGANGEISDYTALIPEGSCSG